MYSCIHHRIKMRYCCSFVPLKDFTKIKNHVLNIVLANHDIALSLPFLQEEFCVADMSDSLTFFTESALAAFIFFFLNRVFTFLKENMCLKVDLSYFRLYLATEFQVTLQLICV